MMSTNLIERHQALDLLLDNPSTIFALSVIIMMVVAWLIKDWM